MRAVIAYLLHNHIDSALLDYDIQEIKELAKVIGFEVESVVIQKREPDVKYFMGEGKVKELSAMVKDLGVDAVIFNEELSPRQVRHWRQCLNLLRCGTEHRSFWKSSEGVL